MKARPLVLIASITTIVIAYWALIFFAQRSLLFPRPPVDTTAVRPADAKQVWFATSSGRVEGWFLPPTNGGGRSPILIFTHGNGELIDYWPDAFELPRRWGIGILLVEYPGYGRSEGQPSQTSIAETVLAAYDWASGQSEIDPKRIW